jgi:LmbE family N-acetylglucosaminyl deacetylase
VHILGVFAHPDDETYSMGGCLARYTDEGVGSTILTFTRGEVGMITEGSGATRETLGEVRERELREACRIVGCTDVRVVGTPDGGTTVTEEGIEEIARLIRELRPEIVITMEPAGVTSHPDHIAVSTMTVQAFERVKFENIVKKLYLSAIPKSALEQWMQAQAEAGVEAFNLDDPLAPRPAPDETIACVIDTGDGVKRKIEALWAHRTQSQEFVASLPEEFVTMSMQMEAFQRAHPTYATGDSVEDDLFAGLR